MTNEVDPSRHAADLRAAGEWLVQHGLTEARPTPLLATRLAVRRRARLGGSLLLAALIIGAALTLSFTLMSTGRFGGFAPASRTPLVILAALVVGLILAQARLDAWVRRVDRQAAATLSRRVAYPIPLDWRAAPGRLFAAYAGGVFVATAALAVSVLPVDDPILRYGGIIVLIGLIGVYAGVVVQLRDVLARPVVADDEDSLAADIIMRVEDAREVATPSTAYALPAVLLYGDGLGWWNIASIVLVVGSVVALAQVHRKIEPSTTVARHAAGAR
jgi:hypothetical protein